MVIKQLRNKSYDYVFAGGGLAALSLVYRMVSNGKLKDKKILIIDPNLKNQNDRTWSYWSKEPGPFGHLSHKVYDEVAFYSSLYTAHLPLDPYRYYVIRSLDFYQFVHASLMESGQVDWLCDEVQSWEEKDQEVVVSLKNKEKVKGQRLFSSIFTADQIRESNAHRKSSPFLWQHFVGWFVQSEEPVWNDQLPILFDFRTRQKGVMRFLYTLPTHTNSALVEYTLFSEQLLTEVEYEAGIDQYLKDQFKDQTFKILEKEAGKIPMTSQAFPVQSGKRVHFIGTAGGITKASTGYTFSRVQKDVQLIADSLAYNAYPIRRLKSPLRFQLYDFMLLKILEKKGHLAEQIFSDLFQKNPIQRIFAFLDEESSFGQELRVMASVPIKPFLWALWKRFF